MTLDELQNLTMADINNMSTDELQSALKYGKKILINRYKTQKKIIGSVAPVFKENNPYNIRTTNLTRNQTVNRLVSTIQRTKAKTTTIQGFKSWRKKQNKLFDKTKGTEPVIAKGTGKPQKNELTEKDYKKIWDMYDRVQQLHPKLIYVIDYKKVIEKITEYVKTHERVSLGNIDKVLKKLALEDSETSAYYAQEEWDNML